MRGNETSTCRPMFSQNLLSPWKWRRSLGADNGDASGLTTKPLGLFSEL